jgi:hypothetical protein
MVSRPVCLGIKHPSRAYDQIFIAVRQLQVCWCGALSLTRGRVCRFQLLLILDSAVILWSESRGTRDHILLSQIRNLHFRRLLRFAGLRWGYSTLPSNSESSRVLCYDRRSVGQCVLIKHPSGSYDQIVIRVRQLKVCRCGVYLLQLLLVLASVVILWSESRGTIF